MKARLVLYLFILATCLFSGCNGRSTEAEIKATTEVLKVIVEEESIDKIVIHPYGEYLLPLIEQQELKPLLKEYLDDDFTWNDLKNQRKKSALIAKHIHLSSKQINCEVFKNVVDSLRRTKSNEWNGIVDKFGSIRGYSIPIFSPQKDKAFVYTYEIYGKLAGYGCCMFYARKNEKWILVYEFDEWES
ncbi:hypothetical protein EYV94_16380 [Puteibacter caeruleilacunae]|nr:hypothetical protein EYV94_16380 [Puteibacter caeruleilacunae]